MRTFLFPSVFMENMKLIKILSITVMSNKQANFFNKQSRSRTENSYELKRSKQKRNEGNSQFIKSKFDIDYQPKFRALKLNKSPYASKQQIKDKKANDLNQLILKTQQEVKSGKKIIIDWSQQHNFRTTRFPSLDDRFTQSKRANTEQIHIRQMLDSPKDSKYSEYLNNLEKASNFKEIVAKGEHLKALISSSILERRRVRTRASIKLNNYQSQLSPDRNKQKSQSFSQIQASLTTDPHFNYAIIEEVEQKNREFFQKNNQKIMQAINIEKNLQNSFLDTKGKSKSKVDEIHHRIVCKSKLTLLKSELIKKFKEIKEGILEDHHRSSVH